MAAEPETKDTTKQVVCEPAIMPAPPMSTWNDKRLDELSARTDSSFEEVKAEIKGVKAEIKGVKAEMGAEFKAVRQEMHEGFKEVNQRFDRLSHILIVGGMGIIASLVGVIGAILVAAIFG